jgi:DNA-binding MarR family transcriptional regulator
MGKVNLEPLTREVYEFVRDFRRREGYSPTLREIGSACFVAHTTVLTHVARLEGMGWLTRDFLKPRSIRLGDLAPDYIPELDGK